MMRFTGGVGEPISIVTCGDFVVVRCYRSDFGDTLSTAIYLPTLLIVPTLLPTRPVDVHCSPRCDFTVCSLYVAGAFRPHVCYRYRVVVG